MIKPFIANEAFLADIELVKNNDRQIHLWWLGQSGFLLQWQGTYLLFDPYLSDSLTKKYAGTAKPHVRMTGRVISPEQLNFIDILTSSHNHTDHLDPETIHPLLQANPAMQIVVPAANRESAGQKLGIGENRITAIDNQQPVTTRNLVINAIPSAHESLETDPQGLHKYLGYIVQAGPFTLYHPGDTVRYPGLADHLRRWEIYIAMLPINGRDPNRGVAGNLDGAEAVRLAQDAGMQIVIPCHYEMFEFNTVSPSEFIHAARAQKQAYQILRNGERWSCPPT
jgi:L-ascorbate metabolism protein UlaG (beta-lactamase superfamily)